MNKKRQIQLLGIFFAILILVLIIKNQMGNHKSEPIEANKKSSSIECHNVPVQNIAPKISFSGRISSAKKINILSEVNGISEIYNDKFEVGENFKKGEVLISIKNDDIELDLKSIKSQFLALLIQVLPDIKMDFPKLGSELEKYINEFQLNGQIANLPKTTNSKQRNFLSSKQVFSNYYTIKSLENKLNKFKIRAPFDGVLTQTLIDIGSNIIVGQPLGQFIDPNNYEISTSVSIKEAILIKEGDPVFIASDDLNIPIKGVVSRIGDHINELTQSIDIFISVDHMDIKDGMYVSGHIECDTIHHVFRLERGKIVTNNSVYLLKDNHLQLKPVNIVLFQDDSVIIKGIDQDDCIVKQYKQYFYDGMPIN